MRLSKRIPCFLMPPLCAAVYLLLDRTGLFFRIYVALFGWDEVGPSLSILCFPLLALLTGILPAVLLTGREHSVWTAWAALFFAGFFAYEFLAVFKWDSVLYDFPLFAVLWVITVLFAVLFHLIPSWIASAVRAILTKRKRPGNAFSSTPLQIPPDDGIIS